MAKRVLLAGLAGAGVLIIVTFIVNGIFRFQVNMDMNQVANEKQVYEVLKQNIVEPGRYVVNPELTPDQFFPENQPVYGVFYGGVGHEAAGKYMLVGLIIFLLAPLIATWLLSQTSNRILSSYTRKVLFFTAIGFLIAVFSDLSSSGIGDYPLGDAITYGIYHIIVWTLIGLVVAALIKPYQVEIKST